MQKQNSKDAKHAEIALAIKGAKKKMFLNSRSGMDLREAADKFAVDVAIRFEKILAVTEAVEDSGHSDDNPQRKGVARLAENPAEWRQLSANITDLVDQLCCHGESDQARRLFSLLDLLTNEDYERLDREILARNAIHRAFTMTKSFEKAIEVSIARLGGVRLNCGEVNHA